MPLRFLHDLGELPVELEGTGVVVGGHGASMPTGCDNLGLGRWSTVAGNMVAIAAWRICVTLALTGAVASGCGGSDPEPVTVRGTFTIPSSDFSGEVRDECDGEPRYPDVNSSTAVLLETAQGDYVDRTDLGPGTLQVSDRNIRTCRFDFEVEVTEGADDGEGFVLSVGDRGEQLYSLEELTRTGGVVLTLD